MPHGVLSWAELIPEWQALKTTTSKLRKNSVYSLWTWELLAVVGGFDAETVGKAFQSDKLGLITNESSIDRAFENIYVMEGLSGLWMSQTAADQRNLQHGGSAGLLIVTYDQLIADSPPAPQYGFALFPIVSIETKPIVSDRSDWDKLIVLGLSDILRCFEVGATSAKTSAGLPSTLSPEYKRTYTKKNIPIKRKEGAKPCLRIDGCSAQAVG